MVIYLPGNGTLDGVGWPGAEIQGIPSDFYPPDVNVGPPVPHQVSSPPHPSPCLLPSYLSG